MATGKLLSTFECPNCGSAVSLRATGLSISASCGNCQVVIGVENENYKVISQFESTKTVTPLIPIGSRGEIDGIQFEVIGFLVRTDNQGDYPWREYLLFNPYYGFRWLVEANGHWSFVTMIKKTFFQTNSRSKIEYQGRSYALFQEGGAKVQYVWGEFYWKIKKNSKVVSKDYVSPPYMLSCEQDRGEIIWSHAVYQNPDFIQKAFNIQKPMPYPIGVAPNQPVFWGNLWDNIKWVSFFFLILVIAIHWCSSSLNTQGVYHSQSAVYVSPKSNNTPVKTVFGINPNLSNNLKTQEIETPPFEFKNDFTVVEVGFWADVSNSWIVSNFELVNYNTEESIPLEEEVSYYEGSDSDGHWAEGSNSITKTISSVAKGKYFLRAEIEADPSLRECKYQIMIKDGVTSFSNLLLALCLIIIIPIFTYWRKWSFEVERWSESDYSPFSTGEN